MRDLAHKFSTIWNDFCNPGSQLWLFSCPDKRDDLNEGLSHQDKTLDHNTKHSTNIENETTNQLMQSNMIQHLVAMLKYCVWLKLYKCMSWKWWKQQYWIFQIISLLSNQRDKFQKKAIMKRIRYYNFKHLNLGSHIWFSYNVTISDNWNLVRLHFET